MKILFSLALTALLAGTASAATPCKLPAGGFIYAIGSSTLGSPLGEILIKSLEQRGFKFRKWAKASSGLARPDYFDWPKQVPDIIDQWKPDAFIVNLGTNDFQAIFNYKTWIQPDNEKEWRAEYGRRVDKILELTAGPDKSRLVVWVGPSPFPQEKAVRLSQIINAVIQERIKAFGGSVFYVDATDPLIKDGHVLRSVKLSSGKMAPVFRKDNVHMTVEVVRDLMAEPTGDILLKCTKG
jgi:hypothetical protein